MKDKTDIQSMAEIVSASSRQAGLNPALVGGGYTLVSATTTRRDSDTGGNPNHQHEPDTYLITLRPLTTGWQASSVQRLRSALKLLLRGFGLRAVSIKPKWKETKD
jgi:hypothetical protein